MSIFGIGANLIQLRAKYDVRVDIPRKDANLTVPAGNAATSRTGSPLPGSDEEDEPTQPVSVTGPLSSVTEAIAELNVIIAAKTSKITQRVRDIPDNVYPFIAGRYSEYEALAEGEGSYIVLTFSASSHELTVYGDRPGVVKVIETVKANIEEYNESLASIALPLNKPQHRLLVGGFAEELMESSKCVAVLPTDPDAREVTLWGLQDDLPQGLQAVMKVSFPLFLFLELLLTYDFSKRTPSIPSLCPFRPRPLRSMTTFFVRATSPRPWRQHILASRLISRPVARDMLWISSAKSPR